MLEFSYDTAWIGQAGSGEEPGVSLHLRTARSADWPALGALLNSAGSSRAGLDACLETTLVLERTYPRENRREIAGCVAVEPGAPALIRSLAVAPEAWAQGLDVLLLDGALRLAHRLGAREVVLLLETAAQIPAEHGESVPWEVLRRSAPHSELVRELSTFDSDALAVRLPLPATVTQDAA
jgi:N-acetylglutamate synthase-like GNAT family acetyltransferase